MFFLRCRSCFDWKRKKVFALILVLISILTRDAFAMGTPDFLLRTRKIHESDGGKTFFLESAASNRDVFPNPAGRPIADEEQGRGRFQRILLETAKTTTAHEGLYSGIPQGGRFFREKAMEFSSANHNVFVAFPAFAIGEFLHFETDPSEILLLATQIVERK